MSQPINLQPIGMTEPTGARKSDFRKLTLRSIGVVYGDIGTSPLYAFKESLSAASAGGQPPADAIIGVISLILLCHKFRVSVASGAAWAT
jgi:KUP system potassium uptake protein